MTESPLEDETLTNLFSRLRRIAKRGSSRLQNAYGDREYKEVFAEVADGEDVTGERSVVPSSWIPRFVLVHAASSCVERVAVE